MSANCTVFYTKQIKVADIIAPFIHARMVPLHGFLSLNNDAKSLHGVAEL